MIISDFGQFVSNFKANAAKFRQQRNDLLLGAVLDTKALIQFRIQTQGQNAELVSFDPYEPAYQKRKARDFANARSGQVDFTLSGRMWRNIKAFIVEESRNQITIELRADNDLDQAKLNSFLNSRKNWGNILTPSADEIELLRQVNLKRLEAFT